MLVSVIIPTHNRPDVLPLTLAALRGQTLPAADYEIVVVDDGSAPAATLPTEADPPRMTLVRLEGVERSRARNAGAEAARGKVLVFIDDDIEANPDFLEAHLRAHGEWPDAIATGKLYLPQMVGSTPFGRFRKALEEEGVPRARGLLDAPNFCAAGNMSIARATFLELGGFAPEMVSGEDQDLAFRHSARGGRLAFLPDAEALHCDRAMDVRSYCRRHESGSAALIPFLRRHPDWPENLERERSWGAIRWGGESPATTLCKLLKAALGTGPAVAILFGSVDLLERLMPRSPLLGGLYRLLLGIHLRKGYDRGLRQYGATAHGRDPSPLTRAAEAST
jgi:glycosyltransferase involved in cell wall biosynthesis